MKKKELKTQTHNKKYSFGAEIVKPMALRCQNRDFWVWIFTPIEIMIWVWDFKKWIQMKNEELSWVFRCLEEGSGTIDGEKKMRKRTKEEDGEQEIES